MKQLKLALLFVCGLYLTGCAVYQSSQATNLDDINFSAKNQSCSRICLESYNQCIRTSGNTFAADVQANILTGCKSTLRACIATCPDNK